MYHYCHSNHSQELSAAMFLLSSVLCNMLHGTAKMGMNWELEMNVGNNLLMPSKMLKNNTTAVINSQWEASKDFGRLV